MPRTLALSIRSQNHPMILCSLSAPFDWTVRYLFRASYCSQFLSTTVTHCSTRHRHRDDLVMARLHTRFTDDLHLEDTGPIARLRPRSCSQVIPLTDHFVPAHRYLLRISVYSLVVAAVVLAVHTYDQTTMTTLDKFKISALS